MPECLIPARAGDRRATATLASQLRPRLERMSAYYARRCGEDADDLLQEAWLGLLEALPTVDPRIGSPEQYLVRHARWRMLDSVRRSKRRRCDALAEEAVERLIAPSEGGPLEWLAVEEFVACLTEGQRALIACLMSGLTWREAGRALGYTSANVAYHVRRIRQRYEAWCGEYAHEA